MIGISAGPSSASSGKSANTTARPPLGEQRWRWRSASRSATSKRAEHHRAGRALPLVLDRVRDRDQRALAQQLAARSARRRGDRAVQRRPVGQRRQRTGALERRGLRLRARRRRRSSSTSSCSTRSTRSRRGPARERHTATAPLDRAGGEAVQLRDVLDRQALRRVHHALPCTVRSALGGSCPLATGDLAAGINPGAYGST